MDKFLNQSSARPILEHGYRVRGVAKDDESISESIENSFYSKKGLPTLNISGSIALSNNNSSKTSSVPIVNNNNPLEDLLDKIDSMNNGFNEPEAISEDLDEQDLELFKDNVKNWISADNSIVELDKKRRELMKIRNSYNNEIIGFMKRYKAGDVNIDNGEKLKFEIRHSKQSFSRKTLQEQINNYFIQNHDLANKLMEHLENNRKVSEIEKIKRVKPK